MKFASPPRRSYVFQRHRARLAIGVTLSLMVHALIVSLQFGIPGLGLPGLELPWNERRAQAPELSIRIANVRTAPSPTAVARAPEPVRTESALRFAPSGGARVTLPSQAPKSAAPTPRAALPPVATPRPRPRPRSAPPRSPTPVISKLEADPDSFVLPSASPEEPAPEPDPMLAAATADEQPEVVDNTAPEVAPEVVPEVTPAVTPEIVPEIAPEVAAEKAPAALPDEPALQAKEQAAQLRKQDEASLAQAIETKKQDDANAERLAAKAEAREAHDQAERSARDQADALAQQRQAEQKRAEDDAAKRAQQLVARQEEEARQQQQAESERRAAELEAEARKQAEESVRRQAAALDRQKKMDERAAREMADREEADTLAEQQRQHDRGSADSLTGDDSNTAPSSKAAVATVLPANLLGGLAGRAIERGRQLDLQRELPPQPAKDARRRSVFGSVDQDIGVTMYIDSWRQKVERNGNMNYRPSAADGKREDPVVTVSIRSDGSVEDIAIVRSSGLPEIDNAVRRIVGLYARYGAFPPDLARRYDVIEIRRIWRFDDKLRIREEMR